MGRPWRSNKTSNKKEGKVLYKTEFAKGRSVYYVEPRKWDSQVTTLNKDTLEEEYKKILKNERAEKPSTLYHTEDKLIITYNCNTDKKSKGLEPGIYQAKDSLSRGLEFIEMLPIVEDTYIDLSGICGEVEQEVSTFFTREQDYKKLGLSWRRSCLMWGPPGNGKSALIKKLVNKYKDNSVIVFLPSNITLDIVEILQSVKYNKILILEEITENAHQDIAGLLKFLDGERSCEGSYTICTTNYPEKLPSNVVDRPSRIDKLYHVDNPGEEQRKIYLKQLLGREITEEELKSTKDFSIAYLKETALVSIFDNKALLEVIKFIDKRKKLVLKEFAKTKEIGFNREDFYD